MSIPKATRALDAVQRIRRAVLAICVAILLPLLAVTASTWQPGSGWHENIERGGLLLIFICIAGRCLCTLYIGGRKSAELVMLGPYSVCRNPLYVASLLGTIGAGMMLGSLITGAVFGLVFFIVFDTVIRREERFLRAHFGERFAAYCATTPRWFPRMSRWQGGEELTVRPGLLFNTVRDASWFLLALPLFESIELLQSSGVLPVMLRIP